MNTSYQDLSPLIGTGGRSYDPSNYLPSPIVKDQQNNINRRYDNQYINSSFNNSGISTQLGNSGFGTPVKRSDVPRYPAHLNNSILAAAKLEEQNMPSILREKQQGSTTANTSNLSDSMHVHFTEGSKQGVTTPMTPRQQQKERDLDFSAQDEDKNASYFEKSQMKPPINYKSEQQSLQDVVSRRHRVLANTSAQEAAEHGVKLYTKSSSGKLRFDNENLVETVKSLRVRIKSLEQIIEIQTEEIRSQASNETPANKIALELVEKYRKRIFAMLVQHRLERGSLKDDVKELNNHCKSLEKMKASYINQIRVAQNMQSDLEAKLELSESKTTRAGSTVTKLEKKADYFSNLLESERGNCSRIEKMLLAFSDRFNLMVGDVKDASDKLDTMNRRCNYAASRIRSLKTTITRRYDHAEEEVSNQRATIKSLSMKVQEAEQIKARSKQVNATLELQNQEIKKLQRERDHFSNQIDDLRQQLSDQKQRYQNEHEQQLASEKSTAVNLRQENAHLREALKAKTEEIQYREQQALEQGSRIHAYLGEVRELREAHENLIRSFSEKIEEKVSDRTAAFQDRHRQLEADTQTFHQERASLQQQLAIAQNELQDAKQQHASYFKRNMDARDAKIRTLQQEFDAYRAMYPQRPQGVYLRQPSQNTSKPHDYYKPRDLHVIDRMTFEKPKVDAGYADQIDEMEKTLMDIGV